MLEKKKVGKIYGHVWKDIKKRRLEMKWKKAKSRKKRADQELMRFSKKIISKYK